MFAAARWTDMINHDMVTPCGMIGPPISGPAPGGMVLIEKLPAAYVTCSCVCSGVIAVGLVHPPPPGPPPPIISGSSTVLINKMPAARWFPSGDMGACGVQLGYTPLLAMRRVFIGGASSVVSSVLFNSIVNGVNPLGSVINCGHIIDSVTDRLTGRDRSASSPAGGDGSFTEIENRHNTSLTWGSSFNSAFNAVQNGGHGTTAIVGIRYSGGTASHVVVMTNHNGNVAILEGQDWGGSGPREVISTPARANQRYNSDGGSDIGWGIVGSNP